MKKMRLLTKNPDYYQYLTCFLLEAHCQMMVHHVTLDQPITVHLIEDVIMVGFKTGEMIYDPIIQDLVEVLETTPRKCGKAKHNPGVVIMMDHQQRGKRALNLL
jgi:hypothetical protein